MFHPVWGLKFGVYKMELHECEHFMEVQVVCMLQQGAFPASFVIWVGIVCDGLVDSAAGLNTLRKK
jgi:hypothetical protein